MEWILRRGLTADGIDGPFGTPEEAAQSLDRFSDAPDDAYRLKQARAKLLARKTGDNKYF
jgi:hypothetical protein